MGNLPNLSATVNVSTAVISASADGFPTSSPSNLVDLVTAGSSGTQVYEISVTATGTTAAGVVNIWLNDGTNTRLYDSILVSAVTPSTTAVPFRAFRNYGNLFIPSGWKVKVSSSVASQNLQATGLSGDF